MKRYEPTLGDTITATAQAMVSMANECGEEVTAVFNEIELFAHPGDHPNVIVSKFYKQINRRHDAYMKSPEGKASLARAAESQRKADEAAAEGINAFTLVDVEAWNKTVEANKDPYGACAVRYAARWAWLMEQRIALGATIADMADETSHEADSEGITGFMYGCAVSILAKVWIHGETLRRWHNLKTQIGTEGVKANESGGTLNPALLNIGGK